VFLALERGSDDIVVKPLFHYSFIADLQKMAVAEWLQSFNSVRGPMERLGII